MSAATSQFEVANAPTYSFSTPLQWADGAVEVTCAGRGTATRVVHLYHRAPYRVQVPDAPAHDACLAAQ